MSNVRTHKFKVGDRVLIKDFVDADFSVNPFYYLYEDRDVEHAGVNSEMEECIGEEAIITVVDPECTLYHIDLDGGTWWYGEEIIELVKKDIDTEALKVLLSV